MRSPQRSAAAAIALGLASILALSSAGAPRPRAQTAAPAQLTEDERNTIDIVKRSKGSVVFVTNIQLVRDFFSFEEQKIPEGSGSGFVWDDLGHIVTNYHVIKDGVEFVVTLPDQEERQAKIVGREISKDIAVLRLQGNVSGLHPVAVGTSRGLQVGQKVLAIGNPFGLDYTVTTGIVSAVGRRILGIGDVTIRDMIQTDASINPGNSGGPLLDSSGALIGMNTMIYSPSGGSSGVGFAVPVDIIKKIVPELIRFGRVTRPELGGVSFVSDEIARRYDLTGAVILQVERGSVADKAGLRGLSRDRIGRLFVNDVITAVDKIPVKSYDDFFNALESYKIGDEVSLTVEREKKTRRVTVALTRAE